MREAVVESALELEEVLDRLEKRLVTACEGLECFLVMCARHLAREGDGGSAHLERARCASDVEDEAGAHCGQRNEETSGSVDYRTQRCYPG